MKRPILLLVLILVLIAIIIVLYLRGQKPVIELSQEAIRNYVLKHTPLGCDKKVVLKFIEENGYEINNEVKLPFLEDAKGYRVSGEHPKVVARYGNNYIRVYLGEYIDVITDEEGSFPYTCTVTVFWVFDGNKLVHINVWKDWDGT